MTKGLTRTFMILCVVLLASWPAQSDDSSPAQGSTVSSALTHTSKKKMDSSDYVTGDFSVQAFKSGFLSRHKLIEEVFKKSGINIKDPSTITKERLKDASNKLISIPNLSQCLDKSLSDVPKETATAQERLVNKQKLAEIYPPNTIIKNKRVAAGNSAQSAPVKNQAVASPASAQPSVPPPSEVHYSNDASIYVNNVTGDGKARSSLTPGTHCLDIFTMNGRQTTSNGYNMTYNIGAKITDDPANDVMHFSFTNLQARWTNNVKTYTVGDILEYYSQYTLNSSLKGVSYRYDATQDEKADLIQHLGVIYGISYPRWDCFTGDDKVKAIMRSAYGATARSVLAAGLTGGLSLIYSADSGRVNPTDTLYSGEVLSFDSAYQPFAGLTVTDELALANVTEQPGGNPNISCSDLALKAEAVGDGGPSRVTIGFEHVGTKFISMLGAATPDREKINFKWRYKYDKDITTNLSLLLYHNNLDGKSATTTSDTQPQLDVIVKAPFDRRSATADVFLKLFMQSAGAANTDDQTLGLTWRDRFGKYDSDSNLSYTKYDTETNITKRTELVFNTALSTTRQYKNATLRPNVSLGVFDTTDDLLSKTNQITEIALGSAIEVPDSNIVSHVKLGENSLNGQIGDSSNKLFFSGDAYRRLQSIKNAQAYLKFLYNSYSFTTAANNYRETSLTAGLRMQF